MSDSDAFGDEPFFSPAPLDFWLRDREIQRQFLEQRWCRCVEEVRKRKSGVVILRSERDRQAFFIWAKLFFQCFRRLFRKKRFAAKMAAQARMSAMDFNVMD